MKKRILSLLLCALMLLTGFMAASCGSEEGNLEAAAGGEADTKKDKPGRPYMTINIYSIRGKDKYGNLTTDKAIEEVEAALSDIAERRFNTSIDLILIEEDQYIEQMFAKIKNSVNTYNAMLLKDDMKMTQTEREEILASNIDYINADGESYNVKMSTNLSTEVLNGSLDIFLVLNPSEDSSVLDPNSPNYNKALDLKNGGKNMFDILYEEKALANLTSLLNNNFTNVKSEIYAEALEYVTRTDKIYGVPNTYIYGDYDYVVFNSKYINALYDDSDFSDFAANPDALTHLVQELTEKKGTTVNGVELNYKNVEVTYTTDSSAVAQGYIANDFAVAYIKGDKAIKSILENAYPGISVIPRNLDETTITNSNDYCDSMFCIGKSAEYNNGQRLTRCMEILQLIQTNTEFRNILQYGVEGVHYTQYSGAEVTPIPSDLPETQYYMDPEYTGNMFLLYPNVDWSEEMKKMAEDHWALAKDQIYELLTSPNKNKK